MTSTKAKTVRRARNLRREMSLPEVLLWRELRKQQGGAKFRRQHPVGLYVIDFYCPSAKLAVEIDGEAHNLAGRSDRDIKRDSYLAAKAIETVRMAASDVMKNAPSVADHIVRLARAQCPSTAQARSPSPSLRDREDLG